MNWETNNPKEKWAICEQDSSQERKSPRLLKVHGFLNLIQNKNNSNWNLHWDTILTSQMAMTERYDTILVLGGHRGRTATTANGHWTSSPVPVEGHLALPTKVHVSWWLTSTSRTVSYMYSHICPTYVQNDASTSIHCSITCNNKRVEATRMPFHRELVM